MALTRPNTGELILYTYPATVIHVVDGDTLDVEIDLGFNVTLTERVRLANIDTSEIHFVDNESDEYAEGIKHTNFVEEWVKSADGVYLYSKEYKTGTYGRVIGDLYTQNGGWLSQSLYDSFDSVELYE